jgi:hypothetical protein
MTQAKKYNLVICNNQSYNVNDYNEIQNYINDYIKNEMKINYKLSRNQVINLININKRSIHPLIASMFVITEI